MYESMTTEFVRTKRRKIVPDSSDGDGGEYNCVSAKRRKPAMGKSQGTIIDDSGWNVSHITSYLTTPTPKTILTTTESVYFDVSIDDRHIQHHDAEKTLCDLDLKPNTDYGKMWKSRKEPFIPDGANNLLSSMRVAQLGAARPAQLALCNRQRQ